MEPVEPAWLSYSRARSLQRTHAIRVAEVPIEHAVSLPLPTLRWGGPGFAQLASPAVRRPDAALDQGAPDRWWVLDATSGRLVVYALTSAIPFAPQQAIETVATPSEAPSLDALRQLLVDLDETMGAVTPDFFAGSPGDPILRRQAGDLLARLVPASLWASYRGLTPDFFRWLEA